ncbi:MAG: hypothetical protein HS126_21800 [Anaerolineales bacterium]|nr:hypothetical protein [Anaerolineales bacterium]
MSLFAGQAEHFGQGDEAHSRWVRLGFRGWFTFAGLLVAKGRISAQLAADIAGFTRGSRTLAAPVAPINERAVACYRDAGLAGLAE